jgi:hypothetical protein
MTSIIVKAEELPVTKASTVRRYRILAGVSIKVNDQDVTLAAPAEVISKKQLVGSADFPIFRRPPMR